MSEFSRAVLSWCNTHPIEIALLFVASVLALAYWSGRRMFG